MPDQMTLIELHEQILATSGKADNVPPVQILHLRAYRPAQRFVAQDDVPDLLTDNIRFYASARGFDFG